MTKISLNFENHLFELARSGRRLPPTWLAVILSILFIFGGQLIGAFPYLILLGLGWMPSADTPIGSALYLLIFFAVTLLPTGILLAIWLSLVEKRPFYTIGFEKPGALKKILLGLAIGTLLFSLVVLLISLPGYLKIEPQDYPSLFRLAGSLIALPSIGMVGA